MSQPAVETARLLLRSWIDSDFAPFAAMGRDARVMAHFPGLLSDDETRASIARVAAHIAAHGFGFWAIERKSDHQFLGFCGLQRVSLACPVEGEVEIGWRLGHAYWGQGYAREAAEACLDHGLGPLGLRRITSFTVAANTRSWGLMERLGLQRRQDLDFDHPGLPAGHKLRPHIVYMTASR